MGKIGNLAFAAILIGAVAGAGRAAADVTWHSIQTSGESDSSGFYFAPSPFDSALGSLQSVDVATSIEERLPFIYFTGEQVASLTLLSTVDWSNWDASGHFTQVDTFSLPPWSLDSFEIVASASEHHTDPAYGFYSDPDYWEFSAYVPTIHVDYTVLEQTGDFYWSEWPEGHYGGITATVTLVYHFTTVPEPTSWAMMVTGSGVIGAALRRRRRGQLRAARIRLPQQR